MRDNEGAETVVGVGRGKVGASREGGEATGTVRGGRRAAGPGPGASRAEGEGTVCMYLVQLKGRVELKQAARRARSDGGRELAEGLSHVLSVSGCAARAPAAGPGT